MGWQKRRDSGKTGRPTTYPSLQTQWEQNYKPKYTEVKFKTKPEAQAYAKEFKLKYGYKPSIFKTTIGNYIIIKPKDLKRLPL
jgi:hypothetical protein